jgi:hypothetical protein
LLLSLASPFLSIDAMSSIGKSRFFGHKKFIAERTHRETFLDNALWEK